MILTIHNLAKEYGLLPSQALSTGTTFDLYVLDVHSRWMRYQQERETGKPQATNYGYSQAQLKQMMDRAKNFKPKERKK